MTPTQRAITALKNARDTFQCYGDLHAAKDPPQPEKAGVNYAMVAEINSALLALAEEEAVGLSDRLQLSLDIVVPAPPPHPAQQRLKAYIDTLEGRDDDSWTQYNALVGDFRALTQL